MVWKWVDGRISKKDPVRRETRSVVPRISRTTETSDDTISLCVRGEGSQRSRAVGVGGRSREAGDWGEVGSLESGQGGRRGVNGGPEATSVDV